MDIDDSTRTPYETPAVRELGSVSELTNTDDGGSTTDSDTTDEPGNV